MNIAKYKGIIDLQTNCKVTNPIFLLENNYINSSHIAGTVKSIVELCSIAYFTAKGNIFLC